MLLDEGAAETGAMHIEALLEDIEALQDPIAREKVTEIVMSLLALYGTGLKRIVEIASKRDRESEGANSPSGTSLMTALTDDDLVAHLLLLHDVHPVDAETRVARALQETRPYLQSHGGDVELIRVEDGVAYMRLQGHCNGCPSSTATLKDAIEGAILRAAPDIIRIEAEGAVESARKRTDFIPISALNGPARR